MKTSKQVKSLYLFEDMPILEYEINSTNILNIASEALNILNQIKANDCRTIFEFDRIDRHDLMPKNMAAKAITYIIQYTDNFLYDTILGKFVLYDKHTKVFKGVISEKTSELISLTDILNPIYPSKNPEHESDFRQLLGFDRVAFENYDLFCQINSSR
jgi:hypothetical protein